MAWLACEKHGQEIAFNEKPFRVGELWVGRERGVLLPDGTIKKIIGRNLKWSDGPVEIS